MKFKDTKYGDLTGQTYKGDIIVNGMNLTSLEGSPKNVTGYFSCSNNQTLSSLKGAPENVKGSFWCSNNPELTSLEGAPENVKGSFWCHRSGLILLEGISKNIGGSFNCTGNSKLTQSEVDKLVKCDIKGKIKVPNGLKAEI